MADQNDLTHNINIANDDNTKLVTVSTDGSKERLDVDASITGGNFQLVPFTPEFHYSVAGTLLNTSTDTTLYTETDIGKIDFVCIAGSNANFEVAIKVDGEIGRASCRERV